MKKKTRTVHQTGISREYKRACDSWKKATDDMAYAQRMYHREKSMSFDQFLSAQLNYKAASKRFDEAFEKETRRKKSCADSSEN